MKRAFCISGGFLLTLLLAQSVLAEPEALLKACRINLTNSAQAIESYARDHDGHLPQDLKELTPKYAPGVRVCPVSLVPYRYLKVNNGGFEVICAGDVHSGMSQTGRGDIAYRSNTGIIWPHSASPLSSRQQKNWQKRQKHLVKKRLYQTYLPRATGVVLILSVVLGLGLLLFKKAR